MTGIYKHFTHSYKYKSAPQTEAVWRPATFTQHFCIFSTRAAGHDQVQRSSVCRKGLFAHHQSFLFHPPVLKPYFHLLVAQVQPVGQLFPFLSVDEFVRHKFILKFSQLWLRVRLSLLSGLHMWWAPRGTWREQRTQVLYFKLTPTSAAGINIRQGNSLLPPALLTSVHL